MAKKDAKSILAELEEKSAKAFEEFERKQKEQREKALSEYLEPLRKKRADAAQQVNDLNTEIIELDKQIADLTGEKPQKAKKGKRGPRKSDDDKMALAQLIFNKMQKSSKNRFSPSELEQFTDGVKARELVALWNESHKGGESIHKEGAKRSTKYFVN